MLTPDQISELHRLHWVENWSLRKIARHLHIGRRTLAKYLNTPASKPARRERRHKIERWKAAIAELLERDAQANAPVIAQHLKPLGFDGGSTIIKNYLRALRKNSVAPGERFDVDWGHSGLRCQQSMR
jgi:transposase